MVQKMIHHCLMQVALFKSTVLPVFKRWDVVLLHRVDLNQVSISQFLLYKDTGQNNMKYYVRQYLQK